MLSTLACTGAFTGTGAYRKTANPSKGGDAKPRGYRRTAGAAMLVGLPNGCLSMRATSLPAPAELVPTPLRWPEPHYRAIVQHTPHLVARFDRGKRLAFLNPAAQAMLNARPEWADRPCSELVDQHPVFAHWEPGIRAAVDAGSRSSGEAEVATPGAARVLRYSIVPEGGSARTAAGALVYAEDVSEEYHRRASLTRRAEYDALSGVLNRAAFLRHLDAAAAGRVDGSENPFAILFLDLDRFKLLNDRRGHAFGDTVLRVVGQRLHSGVRPSDVVGRLGGDEFAVLLRGVASVPDGVAAVQRLQRRVAEPVDVQGTTAHVTASIGLALATEAEDARVLLADADRAMYHAKELGAGHYQVMDNAAASFQAALEVLDGDLRRALTGDELLLHYQPIVSLDDMSPVGVEALVRWAHPERGVIGPQAFLPAAEKSGQITDIDRWVIRQAARQARRWADAFGAGRVPPVSVNISAGHALWADLVEYVGTTLDDCGLPPSALALEITETVMLELSTSTVATLRKLREMGIHISLDDFGTGYSSLSHLRHLAVDSLKIDRSFVHRIPDDPTDAAIVASVVALAHTLGLRVVAEGIETARQRDALRALGCDLGQGYYFGRPAGAEVIEPLLSKHHAHA
jgi:diguanylate cyclase (GGDEF)-like protein